MRFFHIETAAFTISKLTIVAALITYDAIKATLQNQEDNGWLVVGRPAPLA